MAQAEVVGCPVQFATKSGVIVEIDDDRADLAALRGWYRHSSGYIAREVRVDGKRKLEFLHHRVLGTSPRRGVRVDHKDRNVDNNRRCNLRITTPSQNAQNRNSIKPNGLPRGVTWKADKQKWCARATLNYRTHHIGYYDTIMEAYLAVSTWRIEHMTHSDEGATHGR